MIFSYSFLIKWHVFSRIDNNDRQRNLKKQISNLRNTLFDKNKDNWTVAHLDKKDNTSRKLVQVNINNKSLTKSSGIFHDIKSMDGRLERIGGDFL